MAYANYLYVFLSLVQLTHSSANERAIEISCNTANSLFNGEWMVMFYAPWCPACQSLKPTWKSFAKQWSEDLSIKVALVNIDENPGLSGRFLVFQLPSIFHIKDGLVRPYTGQRSLDAFVTWVNDKSYKNIDPLEWWKNPNTLQMKAVGYFFTFASLIKDLHDALIGEYKLPNWAVYTLFGVVTITAGLLIGMLMVVLCDCVFPPKAPHVDEQKQYSKVELKTFTLQSKNKQANLNKKEDKLSEDSQEDEDNEEKDSDIDNGENEQSDAKEEKSHSIQSSLAVDDKGDASSNVKKRKPRKE